ncbi:MAG TPA: tripartite tricarboxylate transporter substrate binding protein [Pseudolabrys sp.]|nr:tripartite tricarboxylate transporter substrate binding protein [Pseudolabrys sp.]
MLKKIALGLLAVAALALPAQAQNAWPPKNVRIIAPFGPGSTPDIVARLIAEQLGKQYPNSTFIVENKAGASGNTGTDVVAKAAADGTTIGVSIGGPLAINTLLFSSLPYDPKKDIAAVTQLITQPSVLAVSNDLGVNSVQELVALMKANPGKYNFSSIGNGSLSHLAMEAVAIKAGTRIVHIPYKSSPEAILAVIRNDAQMSCLPAIAAMSQAREGKVKALAVSTAERSPYIPDLPTLKESGIDVDADAWMGLIAPGGTPKPIVDAINKDVVAIIKMPELKDKLALQLMAPVGSTPEQFRARIDGEIDRWAPVIKAADVKVN